MGLRARRLGETLRIFRFCSLLPACLSLTPALPFHKGGKQPLRLVQAISLPNVKGRLDHIDVDVAGKR
jgi:hypothetical protein